MPNYTRKYTAEQLNKALEMYYTRDEAGGWSYNSDDIYAATHVPAGTVLYHSNREAGREVAARLGVRHGPRTTGANEAAAAMELAKLKAELARVREQLDAKDVTIQQLTAMLADRNAAQPT